MPTPVIAAWLAEVSLASAVSFVVRHGAVMAGTLAGVGYVTQPYASSYVQKEAQLYLESPAYATAHNTKLEELFQKKGFITVAQFQEGLDIITEQKDIIEKLDDQVDVLRMNDRANAEILRELNVKSDSQQNFNNRLFDFIARNGNNGYNPPSSNPGPNPLNYPNAPVAPPVSSVPTNDVNGQILNDVRMPGLSLENPFVVR